jgi:hypothetical protein
MYIQFAMMVHGRASDLRFPAEIPACSDLRQTQRQPHGVSIAVADASRHNRKQVILSDQPSTCHAQIFFYSSLLMTYSVAQTAIKADYSSGHHRATT